METNANAQFGFISARATFFIDLAFVYNSKFIAAFCSSISRPCMHNFNAGTAHVPPEFAFRVGWPSIRLRPSALNPTRSKFYS